VKIWVVLLLIGFLPIEILAATNTIDENSTTLEIEPIIGEEPKKIEEVFLREEKILLKKGQSEIEIGFSYSENTFLYQGNTIRSLTLLFTGRYGITNDLLVYIIAPFHYNYNEILTEGKSEYHKSIGLGDLRGGVNYQIMYEGFRKPDLMLSLEIKSNTGKSPYNTPPDKAPLGTGHWECSVGLKSVRTIDPVVLFAGVDYTFVFERKIKGNKIKPGDSIHLELGTGFALNDEISMSFRTIGSYTFQPKENNKEYGKISTPFLFNFSLVKILGESKFIQPSVSFGITNDATDLILGTSYIQQF
jgi:hypothetical protein